MRRRLLLPPGGVLIVVALMAGGVLAWAAESNNAVASGEVSATIALARQRKEVHVTNDGPAPSWVYVWECDQTPTAITTSTSGARKILPGEGWGLSFPPETSACAVTHITAAGTTATLRLFAQ